MNFKFGRKYWRFISPLGLQGVSGFAGEVGIQGVSGQAGFMGQQGVIISYFKLKQKFKFGR